MSYTIAKYIRVSVEDQDLGQAGKPESNSIVNQRNLLADFVSRMPEAEGADILEFSDDGWSGKNFERPAVREMLEKVKRGEIQCIVVKDLSRFGRDYLAVGNYLSRVFPFLGVRFIAVNDGFDSIRPMDADSLETSFKTLLYDLYSRDLSCKVRQAKRARAGRGDFLSPYAPYGYVKAKGNGKKLVVDPEAAETVRRIFSLAAGGESTAGIARILNKGQVPTPMAYKRAAGCPRASWPCIHEDNFWTGSAVAGILRDERYTGKSVYGKHTRDEVGKPHVVKTGREGWIVVEGAHEGIVTQEEFDSAKERLRANTKRGPFPHGGKGNPFNRKVRCGVCGYAMRRVKADSPYYYCGTPVYTDSYQCPAGRIPESDLMDAVLTGLRAQASYAVEVEHIREEKRRVEKSDADGKRKAIASLKEDCKGLDNWLCGLYEKFAFGKMGRQEYLEAKNMAVKKRDAAAARIRELEAALQEIGGEGRRKGELAGRLRQYTDIEGLTAEIAAEVLKEIKIYPGRTINILWNFQEDLGQMLSGMRGGGTMDQGR